MTKNANKNPLAMIEDLNDEAKYELLEHLADELGFELTELGDAVDPQSDIIDIVQGAIGTLKGDLGTLQAQFAAGAELDYAELSRAGKSIEFVVSELLEAHGNLNIVIDAEFDVDEGEDDDAEGDGK